MDPTITEQAAWERECTRTLEDCVSLGAVDGADHAEEGTLHLRRNAFSDRRPRSSSTSHW
jgi:hypothetical protein